MIIWSSKFAFVQLTAVITSMLLKTVFVRSVTAQEPQNEFVISRLMSAIRDTQNFMHKTNDLFVLHEVKLERVFECIEKRYFNKGNDVLIAINLDQKTISQVDIKFIGISKAEVYDEKDFFKPFRGGINDSSFFFCFLDFPHNKKQLRHSPLIITKGGDTIRIEPGYLNLKHVYVYSIKDRQPIVSVYNLNRTGYKILADSIKQIHTKLITCENQRKTDSLTIEKSRSILNPCNLVPIIVFTTGIGFSAVSFYRAETEYQRYLNIGRFNENDDTFKDYRKYNEQGQIAALSTTGGIVLWYGLIRRMIFKPSSKIATEPPPEDSTCPDP